MLSWHHNISYQLQHLVMFIMIRDSDQMRAKQVMVKVVWMSAIDDFESVLHENSLGLVNTHEFPYLLTP